MENENLMAVVEPEKKNNEEMDFVEKNNKKKIFLIIGSIILALVLILGGLIAYVKLNFTAEKFIDKNIKIINKSIASDFSKCDEKCLVKYDEKISSGNIRFSTNNDLAKDLNNLNFDYNFSSSKTKNFNSIELTIKDDTKNILNGTLVQNKKDLFIDSKDIFDVPLKYQIPDEFYDTFNEYRNLSIDDYKEFLTSFVSGVGNALKAADLTTKNSGFNVEYTIEINKNNIDKVYDAFKNTVKDDKIFKIFKEMIEESYINEESEEEITFDTFRLTVQYNIITGALNEFTIVLGDETYHGEKIGKNKYRVGDTTIEKNNNTITIIEYENDKEIGSIVIKSTENELSVAFKDNSESKVVVNFSLITEKDNIKSEFYLSSDDVVLKYNINSQKLNDNEMKTTSEISLLIDNEEYNLNIDENTKFGNNIITEKNITNAKDVTSLTEDDQMTIMMNLMTKLSQIEVISSIIESLNASDDFDNTDLSNNLIL